MNKIKISKSKMCGKIIIPPSKSISHRAILCASLAGGKESIISNIVLSDDIKATISVCRELGAELTYIQEDKKLKVRGINDIDSGERKEFFCNESGSTLRFIIPIAMALYENTIFTAKEGLAKRPLQPYYDIFDKHDIKYNLEEGILPLHVKNKLICENYFIDGSVSSQFISGLLLAAPLLGKEVSIMLSNELESKSYVDITIEVMKTYGICVEEKRLNNTLTYIVKGGQNYLANDYEVEMDCSQLAFWHAANYLGSHIHFDFMEESLQGDYAVFHHISRMKELRKADFREDKKEKIYVIDAKNIPDIIPILSAVAAITNNITVKIINASRLRIKECDRLMATASVIKAIGGSVIEGGDFLEIHGQKNLKGGVSLDSFNDHRIAMMIGIIASVCDEEIVLSNYESVNKSYPDFWEEYKRLGGDIVYI